MLCSLPRSSFRRTDHMVADPDCDYSRVATANDWAPWPQARSLGFDASVRATWRCLWLGAVSDFRVQIKKCFDAGAELFLDGFLAALENTHGYVRLLALFQADGSVSDGLDLVGGQKAHSVHEGKVRLGRIAPAEMEVGGGPVIYNRAVLKYLTMALCIGSAFAAAQQNPDQPQVRVNYLNVCTPAEPDQKELADALARIPLSPHFATDFEIARGRSSMENAPISDWVRVRREFPRTTPLIAAQYSFSVDEKSAVEALVFRTRDQKDLLQVLIEDTVTGAASPAAVVTMNTPAERIRIERFGKSSLVLARCSEADQRAYEPLFRKASDILRDYRASLGVSRIVPHELAELKSAVPAHPKPGNANGRHNPKR